MIVVLGCAIVLGIAAIVCICLASITLNLRWLLPAGVGALACVVFFFVYHGGHL